VPFAKLLSNAKCILITTEHSTNNRRRDIVFFKYLDKFIYSKYSAIISISTKATELLTNFIKQNINVYTIENGIDIIEFSQIKQIHFCEQDKIITMVAGFRGAKDQDTLIRSMSLLPNKYKLWLVGDGERSKILGNLVIELGLTERVKFWGIRSDIPQILEQSHVVVLSSHWEGLSLSSIEGMASGRPFIASNVDELQEIVDGYGILFPHQDYVALANEIKSICENQEKYNQIVSACQKRAKQFDINIMAEKYNQLYLDVIF
jgi:glycosyltransferase involved in cell wall biosynthesis